MARESSALGSNYSGPPEVEELVAQAWSWIHCRYNTASDLNSRRACHRSALDEQGAFTVTDHEDMSITRGMGLSLARRLDFISLIIYTNDCQYCTQWEQERINIAGTDQPLLGWAKSLAAPTFLIPSLVLGEMYLQRGGFYRHLYDTSRGNGWLQSQSTKWALTVREKSGLRTRAG
jgi:hypothetical protein